MYTKAKNSMPLSEIVAFFDNLDVGGTWEENILLNKYRSAASKQDYVEEELFCKAADGGTTIKSHSYTFDVDNDPFMAELCPDGISGRVSLLRFCKLFFVRVDQYGEGSEDLGPYPNLAQAEEAFEEVQGVNEP